eukprot:SAG22_NODE_241_length_14126_cov_9.747202_6_plen_42_part_00
MMSLEIIWFHLWSLVLSEAEFLDLVHERLQLVVSCNVVGGV